jgi:type I restriction enzyme S subunit
MNKVWPKLRLGEVLTPVVRPEAPIPGTTYRQLGVKLWGQGAYERESIDGAATKYATLSRSEVDDIVVNKIWARNGSVAVVQPQLAGCFVSGEFPSFVANPQELLPRWIHWLTKTAWFWAQCDEKSQGTSGKNRIKPEQFLNVEIALPPLAEQRRVVARIEALAAQIADAHSLRQEAQAETKAVLQAAKRMILSSVKEANRPKLREIAELRYGISAPISNATDPALGQPIVRMANVSIEGDLDLSDMRYIPASAKEQQQFRLERGDLLLNWRSGSSQHVGKTAIFDHDGDYLFASFLLRIRPSREKVFPEWLKSVLNFMRAEGVFLDAQRFQVNTKLNASEFGEFEIIVPPLPEQCRILSELDALQAQVDPLKRLQAETAAGLDALLPAILDRAFKGKL